MKVTISELIKQSKGEFLVYLTRHPFGKPFIIKEYCNTECFVMEARSNDTRLNLYEQIRKTIR